MRYCIHSGEWKALPVSFLLFQKTANLALLTFLATFLSGPFILNAASQRSSKHILFQQSNTDLQQVNGYPSVIYSNVHVENGLRLSGDEVKFSAETVLKYSSTKKFCVFISNNPIMEIKNQNRKEREARIIRQ